MAAPRNNVSLANYTVAFAGNNMALAANATHDLAVFNVSKPDAKEAEQQLRASIQQLKTRLTDLPAEYQELRASLLDALAAHHNKWVACKYCHHKVEAFVPDWNARIKAYEVLFNQDFGRPAQREPKGPEQGVERTRQELEAMTDEELLALAGG